MLCPCSTASSELKLRFICLRTAHHYAWVPRRPPPYAMLAALPAKLSLFYQSTHFTRSIPFESVKHDAITRILHQLQHIIPRIL